MQYYFVFCNESLLLQRCEDGTCTVPLAEEPPTALKPWTTPLHVSALSGFEVFAYSIDHVPEPPQNAEPSAPPPPAWELVPLRQSFYRLPRLHYLMAGKCAELLFWDKNTRFCGLCGGPMKRHTDISKRCEHCGKEVWPQLSPAVIVRITRGQDEILMARARNFRGDFYGLIAGFVETGETLEEAVVREVHEETGLEITNIRYFGSQPWPYPCGLMVGYTAEYAGGVIRVQREELKNVAWFHRNHLPNLPEPLSIARHLIDDWLGEPSRP